MALTIQHVHIFPRRRGGHILLLQQIHIVDDGRQRRLDVVGYVGDQLGFQVLGLHLLLHRLLQAGLHVVQLLPVALEVADEVLRVDGRGEVAARQLFAALLQRPQAYGDIQHHQQLHELQRQKHTVSHTVEVVDIKQELRTGDDQPYQRGLPHQRQPDEGVQQRPENGSDNAPEEPGYPPDQRTSQDGARLALGGKDAQEQQHQRHQRRAEEHSAPFIVKRIPADEKRT